MNRRWKKVEKPAASILLILAMLFSMCSCGFDLSELSGKASSMLKKAQSKAAEIYGSAKTSAVYLYDEASELSDEGKAIVNQKANQLVGNVKDYFVGLDKTTVDEKPQHSGAESKYPIKDLSSDQSFDKSHSVQVDSDYETEQFATYYISSVLTARGYKVLNGAVYYKGEIYGGLIFTNNEPFIEEDGNTICSCGFIQLVSKDYSGLKITDRMVETGLIAVSAASVNGKAESFIVDEYAVFDSFSGIYNDRYFSYKQIDHYVLEIETKDNKKANYDKTIALYDFDNNRTIYSAKSVTENIENLYLEDNNSFNGAAETVNAIVDLDENCEDELKTVIVLDGNVLDGLLGMASTGAKAISKFVKTNVGAISLHTNEIITIDEKGNTHLLGSDQALDESRVTDGLIETIGSGLGTAGAVVSIVVASQAGSLVITSIVVTTGVSAVVYNISNMLEGAQDVYYGAKGGNEETSNPVLKIFKKFIPDEETATLLYHIWGAGSTMVSMLSVPAARALKLARVKGLNTFSTATNVARAALTTIAKAFATGIGSGFVANYVAKVVTRVSGNENMGKLVGFGTLLVTGFVLYQGLDRIDQKANISGLYPQKQTAASFAKTQESQIVELYESEIPAMSRGEEVEITKALYDQAIDFFEIEDPPTLVIVYDAENELIAGGYNHEYNYLEINMLSYDNCTLEGLIDTIGHEMCHASQWQNGNRAMLNSLRNYKSPDAGFDAYWNQLCERDARQGGVDFLDFILDAVQGLAA